MKIEIERKLLDYFDFPKVSKLKDFLNENQMVTDFCYLVEDCYEQAEEKAEEIRDLQSENDDLNDDIRMLQEEVGEADRIIKELEKEVAELKNDIASIVTK